MEKVKKEKAPKIAKAKESTDHHLEGGNLIIAVVNRGFSENVIYYARKAGATGATVLSGRGAAKAAESFMGMNVMPGREIVMIVVSDELSDEVMKTISEQNGSTSPAGGVCFCVPVKHMTKLKH